MSYEWSAMFIMARFSKETAKTNMTRQKVATLAKRGRPDSKRKPAAIAAVTATAKNNLADAGSLRINKPIVAESNTSAPVYATTRALPSLFTLAMQFRRFRLELAYGPASVLQGKRSALVFALIGSGLPRRHFAGGDKCGGIATRAKLMDRK